ncbi:conjugative transfer signal peptidase TraF [Legionella pneumophila]|uniref:conjugative transfer signal peptidase TraF n=1 Tax=Legionella pneumophila TaxID=446 RepID=UPI0010216405|nr:conjugative transfer signal peptidase TraF [Legionella pneumophila]RYW83745.1 conjugative transfer signal peptidase TraF [Legionella pneumophila]HCD9498739.1 conjugative transfer signal peptidase TraF [Legionella pneumophila]
MKQLTTWTAVFMLSIFVLSVLLVVMGFRINTTDSIPIGLYRMTADKNLKNAYVIFCPDDRAVFQQALKRGYINSGLCPDGYGYLMKKVVATTGDKLTVNNKGVFVNDRLIPYSQHQLKDALNRSLPQWQAKNYQLNDDEVMTMTDQNQWSFDGRYYGPIKSGQIKGMLTPIWVYPKQEKIHES